MKKKLLIIGAKGMLGRALAGVFADRKPICWDRNEIDITREEGVKEKIAGLAPEIIINAAAYTDVDACETNRESARAVNGYAVGYLAKAAKDLGAVFAHYSTDYVFDGKSPDGYREGDKPARPVNYYGESKLLGEELIRSEKGLRHYLIRTSWLFGKQGKNFVQTMLENAKTNRTLSVVNDQHGKPTYARDLAVATRTLIEAPYESGTYHLVNEPVTTWYDFARAIFDAYAATHPKFKKPDIIPCNSSAFPRPAKRPSYSLLRNTKFSPMRPWKEALEEHLKNIDENPLR